MLKLANQKRKITSNTKAKIFNAKPENISGEKKATGRSQTGIKELDNVLGGGFPHVVAIAICYTANSIICLFLP